MDIFAKSLCELRQEVFIKLLGKDSLARNVGEMRELSHYLKKRKKK